MPALERVPAMRVAARAAALDAAVWPAGLPALRTAPDEVLLLGTVDPALVADPHALVAVDTGWFGVWFTPAESTARLARHCRWDWSRQPGPLAQGAIAGLPVKLWTESDRVLWLVPEAFAAEFEARLL